MLSSKLLKAELVKLGDSLERRLAAVTAKLASDPLKRYLDCEREFREWLERTQGPARYSDKAIAYTDALKARSDAAMKECKARDDVKLMDERFELECAIQEWNDIAFRWGLDPAKTLTPVNQ